MSAINAALLAAALLFVLFMLGQALLPALVARAPRRAAHARLSAAISRASAASSPLDRGQAMREAAIIALEELRRPRLAARYARWAHESAPGDPEVVRDMARALIAARRHRALERMLWQTLDAHPSAHEAARDALIALYEGPLESPERARVLARLPRASR